MKILWFCMTPALATEKMTGKLGIGNGWVSSLQYHLTKRTDIELGLVFPWKTNIVEQFELDKTTYFAFPQFQRNKFQWFIAKHRHLIEPDNMVETYLEIIENFKPDVIHIFGSEKNYGLIIPKIQIPTLIWIQGNLTVYTHMWFNGFSKRELIKYMPRKSYWNGVSHLHKYYKAVKTAKKEAEIFKSCNHFLGRTQWDKRITSILSPNANYYHCDEILRHEFYNIQWKPNRNHEKIILFSTIQNNLYKGMEMIFGCCELLIPILGDKFEWRIAGISSKHDLLIISEKKFKKKASELNISPLGRIPSPELIQQLLSADIFVHPSHIDNSPNSVCEAMIIGMPVISTNTGGVPDLLNNRKEGLLVQPGDIYAMTGAILELIKDKEIAIAYGQNARKTALKRHDPNTIVDDLVNISKALAASS